MMCIPKVLVLGSELEELIPLLLKHVNDDLICVSIADSEHTAVQRLQNEHFDLLILSDDLLPNCDGRDFLVKWRSQTKNVDTLTLMVVGKSSRSGFVRAPVYWDEAHAYIGSPFGPQELYERINKLLMGASTQRLPGDEGYTRYEDKELNIVFNYPAFWVIHARYLRKTEVLQRFYIDVIGPMNRHWGWGIYSIITVSMYCPPSSDACLESKVAILHEFEEWKENVQPATSCRQVQICGLEGRETEYTWSAKERLVKEGDQGRTILTMVRRDEKIYVLSLAASEDGFDDFRPAYAHFLETFEFLD